MQYLQQVLFLSLGSCLTSQTIGNSPQITNPGIKCEGIDNDKCYNKMEYYEYNKYIYLELYYVGDGPFNISWFFNFTHLLNRTINSQYQNDTLNKEVHMDDPQKQEGFYSAVVSNIFGSNQSITYLTYHCPFTVDVYGNNTNVTIRKMIGDSLLYNTNFIAKIDLFICYSQKKLDIIFQDIDSNCVHCLENIQQHQCGYKQGAQNIIDRQFHFKFNYSGCPLSYNVSVYKHHLNINDTGFLVFATHTGQSYKSLKIIELVVYHHQYSYVYIVVSVVMLTIMILLLLTASIKVKKHCLRHKIYQGFVSGEVKQNKKPGSGYSKIGTSGPPPTPDCCADWDGPRGNV